MQQLDLYALTWAASVEAGAPLCRAHTDNAIFRDLELVLKGGQIGQQDFFALAVREDKRLTGPQGHRALGDKEVSDRNPALQSTREKTSAAISTIPAISRKGGL